MNELMTTTTQSPIEVLLQVGEDGKVSALNVYEFLGYRRRDYARWANSNIVGNQFAEENVDFKPFRIDAEQGGSATTDYRLSIPFAKKLCMLARSERGEQAREYFIKVEDTLMNVARNLPALTQNEMILQLAQSAVELERKITAQDEKILAIGEAVRESTDKLDATIKTFAAPSFATWKSDMNRIIATLVETYELSKVNLLGRMYRELEAATNADLSSRVKRMQKRLRKAGATYKECIALTKLDVIDRDKQLRAAFEGVVKHFQAVYAAKVE